MINDLNTEATTKDPYNFAFSVKDEEIEKTIEFITLILSNSYLCGQYGFMESLNDEQELIMKVHGKALAEKLSLPFSERYNEKLFLWARKNIGNYRWIYKLWVSLNTKFHSLHQTAHKDFRLMPFFMNDKIYQGKQ